MEEDALSFSAQGRSVQFALYLENCLVCLGMQPGLSGWCAVSQTSGPRACTLLCLSDEMSCRKQAVCLWDRHESDVCEPVQAEPLGRLLGDVGVWVTRGENNKDQ